MTPAVCDCCSVIFDLGKNSCCPRCEGIGCKFLKNAYEVNDDQHIVIKFWEE